MIEKSFVDYFGVQHPIAVMAMNKVSNVPLAVAVRKAGGVPSLSIFNYFTHADFISATEFKSAIDRYKELTGNSAALLISIGTDQILDDRLFNVLVDTHAKILEYIPLEDKEDPESHDKNQQANHRLQQLRQECGTLIFQKVLDEQEIVASDIDGIILKGPAGAGRGTDRDVTLDMLFDAYKQQYPTLPIIASGGIGTAEQVKHYMDKGAWAVGVGTVFAVSIESKIPEEVKLKMLAEEAVVQRLVKGANQNAIVFKEMGKDDFNNTHGLIAGIKDGRIGHVFAGDAIKTVKGIKSVSRIMHKLVSLL
jgi:NAD(P)H-dependent flavin oxidoreductase YrpB (nitropropane dioxygenase family)